MIANRNGERLEHGLMHSAMFIVENGTHVEGDRERHDGAHLQANARFALKHALLDIINHLQKLKEPSCPT